MPKRRRSVRPEPPPSPPRLPGPRPTPPRDRMVLCGHTATVHRVVALDDCSPPRVATASADGTVRVFERDSGRCSAVLRGHVGEVLALAGLGGGRVVSGARDGVRVWEVGNGAGRLVGRCGVGAGALVAAVEGFGGDGGFVAAVDGVARDGAVKGSRLLWYAVEEREGNEEGDLGPVGTRAAAVRVEVRVAREVPAGHTNAVNDLAVCGGVLATASSDRTSGVWEGGKRISTLRGHKGNLYCVSLSEEYCVTSGEDCSIRVYATGSWQFVRAFDVCAQSVGKVVIRRDVLVACSVDGVVCCVRVLEDLGKAVLCRVEASDAGLFDVAVLSDLRVAVASTDGKACIFTLPRAASGALRVRDGEGGDDDVVEFVATHRSVPEAVAARDVVDLTGSDDGDSYSGTSSDMERPVRQALAKRTKHEPLKESAAERAAALPGNRASAVAAPKTLSPPRNRSTSTVDPKPASSPKTVSRPWNQSAMATVPKPASPAEAVWSPSNPTAAAAASRPVLPPKPASSPRNPAATAAAPTPVWPPKLVAPPRNPAAIAADSTPVWPPKLVAPPRKPAAIAADSTPVWPPKLVAPPRNPGPTAAARTRVSAPKLVSAPKPVSLLSGRSPVTAAPMNTNATTGVHAARQACFEAIGDAPAGGNANPVRFFSPPSVSDSDDFREPLVKGVDTASVRVSTHGSGSSTVHAGSRSPLTNPARQGITVESPVAKGLGGGAIAVGVNDDRWRRGASEFGAEQAIFVIDLDNESLSDIVPVSSTRMQRSVDERKGIASGDELKSPAPLHALQPAGSALLGSGCQGQNAEAERPDLAQCLHGRSGPPFEVHTESPLSTAEQKLDRAAQIREARVLESAVGLHGDCRGGEAVAVVPLGRSLNPLSGSLGSELAEMGGSLGALRGCRSRADADGILGREVNCAGLSQGGLAATLASYITGGDCERRDEFEHVRVCLKSSLQCHGIDGRVLQEMVVGDDAAPAKDFVNLLLAGLKDCDTCRSRALVGYSFLLGAAVRMLRATANPKA